VYFKLCLEAVRLAKATREGRQSDSNMPFITNELIGGYRELGLKKFNYQKIGQPSPGW
jgi:hypothetical protein